MAPQLVMMGLDNICRIGLFFPSSLSCVNMTVFSLIMQGMCIHLVEKGSFAHLLLIFQTGYLPTNRSLLHD